MKEAIGTGSTIEAAVQDACEQLGVTTEQVRTEVLKEPSAKTLGLFGGSPAQVKVIFEDSPADKAEGYLRELLKAMGVKEFTVVQSPCEGGMALTVDGEDMGVVIGHRGETLDSLQYLISLVANKGLSSYYRIQLNSGSYREKREKALVALAEKIAAAALKTGRVSHLEAMNPYERRIIHSAVGDMEGVSSWSVGNDRDRHVVIGPSSKEGQTGGDRGQFRGDRDRGPRRGRSDDRRDNNRPERTERRPEGDRPARDNNRDRNRDSGEFKAPPRRENKPFVSRTNQSETTTVREPLRDVEDVGLYGKIDLD